MKIGPGMGMAIQSLNKVISCYRMSHLVVWWILGISSDFLRFESSECVFQFIISETFDWKKHIKKCLVGDTDGAS